MLEAPVGVDLDDQLRFGGFAADRYVGKTALLEHLARQRDADSRLP
jgi:hypothetical protein